MGRVRFGFNGVNSTLNTVYDNEVGDLASQLEASAKEWWHDPRRLYVVGPEGSIDVVGPEGSTYIDEPGPFRFQMNEREVRVSFIFRVERSPDSEVDQALARQHIGITSIFLSEVACVPWGSEGKVAG
jgi:hypothetical protein